MKMFDADKNRMIGLPYGEKNYDYYCDVYVGGKVRVAKFMMS